MSDLDLAGRSILVVEDDYLVARLLSELLEVWGATVIGPAATIELALALLAETERIDLAVVDVNLRGATGFAVADALLTRGVPFIFTTGYETSAIPERYHAVAVLQKPFRQAEIAKALQALIT
jgi:CheY-like chemotaxis protein